MNHIVNEIMELILFKNKWLIFVGKERNLIYDVETFSLILQLENLISIISDDIITDFREK
jgi:hypothetical protein